MTEQTLKELKEKIDLIDQKRNAIMKKIGAQIDTDYEHKGLSIQIPNGPIRTT
jgi:hypothetical protein